MRPEILKRLAEAVDAGQTPESDPEIARAIEGDPEAAGFVERYARIDRVLKGWPASSRGELDWEELAVRIEGDLDRAYDELDATVDPTFDDSDAAKGDALVKHEVLERVSSNALKPARAPGEVSPRKKRAIEQVEPDTRPDREGEADVVSLASRRRMRALLAGMSAFAAAAVFGLAFMSMKSGESAAVSDVYEAAPSSAARPIAASPPPAPAEAPAVTATQGRAANTPGMEAPEPQRGEYREVEIAQEASAAVEATPTEEERRRERRDVAAHDAIGLQRHIEEGCEHAHGSAVYRVRVGRGVEPVIEDASEANLDATGRHCVRMRISTYRDRGEPRTVTVPVQFETP